MEKKVLENHVNESVSFSEVSRKLYNNNFCGNRQTIKNYVRKFSIDTSHFISTSTPGTKNFKKKSLLDILVENSTFDVTHLKDRLYNEGLKERICEKCGQDENWNGEHISLILDHINGKNNDNRIENLRIVCPNCNATLPTHGGKNVIHLKKEKNKITERLLISQRKVKRPEFGRLCNEIKELGYSGTGRKYGVSDNSIRKWIKFYKKIDMGL
jgi:hypothetical protein